MSKHLSVEVIDLATQSQRFREDGFVLLQDLVPVNVVTALRRRAEAVIARLEITTPFHPYHAVIFQVQHAAATDGYIGSQIRSPRLAEPAARLLGVDRLRICINQIICKRPGAKPTVGHQDAPFLPFDDHRSINCWIALSRTSANNGALRYYKGSHRLGRLDITHLDKMVGIEQAVPEVLRYPCIELPMRPGDCAFHHCHTVHAAGPNVTRESRWAISVQFMPDGSRFNGYMHEFMDPYRVTADSLLDQDCFPLVWPPNAAGSAIASSGGDA
jgi:hypothetical protein